MAQPIQLVSAEPATTVASQVGPVPQATYMGANYYQMPQQMAQPQQLLVTVPPQPAPPPPQTFRSEIQVTERMVPVNAPPVAPPPVVAPVAATCAPISCWPRRSWGMVLLMVFNLLMIIVVVILLFVVDLSTNQIADTALLVLVFIFTAVLWWMSCDCGAAGGPDGGCFQPAATC